MPARAGGPGAQAVAKRRRREKLEAKAKEDQAKVDAYFTKYDQSGTGKLSKEELTALLTDMKREHTADPAAEVPADKADALFAKFDTSQDGQIDKSELLPAVRKFKNHLKHEAYLAEILSRHDADKSGALAPAELLTLLNEVAQDTPHKKASDADVEFVMERCDTNSNGVIDFEELGPAIATWKEAVGKLPPETTSSACTLL
jgi:Ca2+-binding EF-hand superfamily protein